MKSFIEKVCRSFLLIVFSILLIWFLLNAWWMFVGVDNASVYTPVLEEIGMDCDNFNCSLRNNLWGDLVISDEKGKVLITSDNDIAWATRKTPSD